jgi:hypothetical protein
MTGHKKGVIAFARKEHDGIELIGCPYHLIHLAAEHAAVFPCKVEDLLTDIYYYLEKSTGRYASILWNCATQDPEARSDTVAILGAMH